MDDCPLCNLNLKDELVYYRDDFVTVLRTKDRKGHKERLMVVWNEHFTNIPNAQYSYALMKLIDIGKKVFSYTPKFIVMEGTFATIKHHFHLVATDLNPTSKDYNQILGTPWLEVVETLYEPEVDDKGKTLWDIEWR